MYQINNAFTYNATGDTIPINHEWRMTTQTSAGPISTKEVIKIGIQDALIKIREITDSYQAVIFNHNHAGIVKAAELKKVKTTASNHIARWKEEDQIRTPISTQPPMTVQEKNEQQENEIIPTVHKNIPKSKRKNQNHVHITHPIDHDRSAIGTLQSVTNKNADEKKHKNTGHPEQHQKSPTEMPNRKYHTIKSPNHEKEWKLNIPNPNQPRPTENYSNINQIEKANITNINTMMLKTNNTILNTDNSVKIIPVWNIDKTKN